MATSFSTLLAKLKDAQAALRVFGLGDRRKMAEGRVLIVMRDASGDDAITMSTAKGESYIRLGRNGTSVFRIDDNANIWLGGNGNDGDIVLFPSTASNDAGPNLQQFIVSAVESLMRFRSGGQETIRIDGKNGDIVFPQMQIVPRTLKSRAERMSRPAAS